MALLAAVGCRSGSSAQGRDDAPVTEAAQIPAGGVEPGRAAAGKTAGAEPAVPAAAPAEPASSSTPVTVPPAATPGSAVEADQESLLVELASTDGATRQRAAAALALLGTPVAAAALAPHAAPGDPLEAVAVAGLGWAGGHEHADRLLAALRSEDAAARDAAAYAVGAAATIDWDRSLAFALQVNRSEVRAAALRAIGLAGRTTMLPDVARWSRDPDPTVRAAAMQALRHLDMPGAALLLAERMKDEKVPGLGAPEEPLRPLAATCPPLPDDPAALESLFADRSASLVLRALAAAEMGRQGHTGPLERVDRGWPRLVRAAALLARARAGDPVRPDDVELERRALAVARLAHPALQDPLDACLQFGVQRGPQP